MKFGVIIFPGSNCDHDAFWTIQQVAKQPVTFLWHDSHDLQNCDAIVVPGGFTADGLPVGVELLGRAWSEPLLIKFAYAYEQATRHCRPPASTPALDRP